MPNVIVKNLGVCDYQKIWQDMYDFTSSRDKSTSDEIWLLEHKPVFTQGIAGRSEHILNSRNIPVVHTNRGGQVTYHGPGQLVGYVLFDLQRLKIGVRLFITLLEKSVVQLLKDFKIESYADPKAPGVYVGKSKICSVGLKISHGCSYHGIALNVINDLEPFTYINPCGIHNLEMTRIIDLIPNNDSISVDEVGKNFCNKLQGNLDHISS